MHILKQFTTAILLILLAMPSHIQAGGDASGYIPHSTDLGKPYEKYTLQKKDHQWSRSLVRRLGYKGNVVHFVRTTIPLQSGSQTIEGQIYQSVEQPDKYYVAEGDLMFEIGSRPHSVGTGGFSMHTPKSKDFIVCLHCQSKGVPVSLSTKVMKGRVWWMGRAYRRF